MRKLVLLLHTKAPSFYRMSDSSSAEDCCAGPALALNLHIKAPSFQGPADRFMVNDSILKTICGISIYGVSCKQIQQEIPLADQFS